MAIGYRAMYAKGMYIRVRVVWMLAHPPRLPARPLRPIDLHARLTRKYLSIFKHIQVYSKYFKEYLENMSSMSSL
jgi:hypothetical protein